jgi:hypothetical protein
VRAEDVDEERVLHVARGVVGRRVERVEVVPLGLDPGTGAHLEAEAVEDRLDLAPHERQRVQRAERLAARRQRDVDDARQVGGQARLVEGGESFGDRALDARLGAVRGLADRGALRRRELAERLHQLGHLPLLAEVARLREADLFLGRERADLARELRGEPIELGDQLAGLGAGHYV